MNAEVDSCARDQDFEYKTSVMLDHDKSVINKLVFRERYWIDHWEYCLLKRHRRCLLSMMLVFYFMRRRGLKHEVKQKSHRLCFVEGESSGTWRREIP